MQKVGCKLAAWSWARDQKSATTGKRHSISLLLLDHDDRRYSGRSSPGTELPPGPPNTGKTTPSGGRSVGHSGPVTPAREAIPTLQIVDEFFNTNENANCEALAADDEPANSDEDDRPIELRFRRHRRSLSLTAHPPLAPGIRTPSPMRRPVEAPSQPHRILSNLAAEDAHFWPHRDSLDLSHRRLEAGGRLNHHLQNSKDSFLLTKGRQQQHIQWSRAGTGTGTGALSPIVDMSPPSAQASQTVLQALEDLDRRAVRGRGEEAGTGPAGRDSGREEGCGGQQAHPSAIAQQEWYAAKYRWENGEMRLLLTDKECVDS